ncbi:MAG: hypothetical protein RL033_5174 [Pseudomonadota bacterium]|jgi:hypothetical protein
MFGIFKKKALPPSLKLTDDELELIHGGRPMTETDAAYAAEPQVHRFDARDAAEAVGGGSGWQGRS